MIISEKELMGLIIESIKNQLLENKETEGFSFGSMGRNSDHTFRFTPGQNDTSTDTRIFDEEGNMRLNKVKLPKSGAMSYNLYKIVNMNISKALKHREESGLKYDDRSMEQFFKRTALYIRSILADNPIDIITYPQSSSPFNAEMVSYLLRLYPNSEGIKLMPNLLTKNVRNIYVNTEVAKSLGLTNDEIHELQNKVKRWRSDEDIRDIRRKIKALEDEVSVVLNAKKRGRRSNEFKNKLELLNTYKEQIPLLRKGKRGIDSTIDKDGNIKDFQIKSIDDKQRRSLEGLFVINPELDGIKNKLRGKNVLIFDDNISSGATLDDICLLLKSVGVRSVLPITLAVIPKTIYGAHERL